MALDKFLIRATTEKNVYHFETLQHASVNEVVRPAEAQKIEIKKTKVSHWLF